MHVRSLLRDNLSWKLLSLGLAILIWFGADFFMHEDIRPLSRPLQPLATRDFHDLPIRLMSPTLAAAAVRIDPASVFVRVGGELAILERLTEKDSLVFVELPADLDHGPVTNRVEVRLPASVRLQSVVPERVIITAISHR
jgi:hypothetical protein